MYIYINVYIYILMYIYIYIYIHLYFIKIPVGLEICLIRYVTYFIMAILLSMKITYLATISGPTFF